MENLMQNQNDETLSLEFAPGSFSTKGKGSKLDIADDASSQTSSKFPNNLTSDDQSARDNALNNFATGFGAMLGETEFSKGFQDIVFNSVDTNPIKFFQPVAQGLEKGFIQTTLGMAGKVLETTGIELSEAGRQELMQADWNNPRSMLKLATLNLNPVSASSAIQRETSKLLGRTDIDYKLVSGGQKLQALSKNMIFSYSIRGFFDWR
jgi:hypothetical protein